jgi:hypothetical protein
MTIATGYTARRARATAPQKKSGNREVAAVMRTVSELRRRLAHIAIAQIAAPIAVFCVRFLDLGEAVVLQAERICSV